MLVLLSREERTHCWDGLTMFLFWSAANFQTSTNPGYFRCDGLSKLPHNFHTSKCCQIAVTVVGVWSRLRK
jgi:hypothetical protein